jgi:hypothetical protein
MEGRTMLKRETWMFPPSFKSPYVNRTGLALQTMHSKTIVGIQEHFSKYMQTHPLGASPFKGIRPPPIREWAPLDVRAYSLVSVFALFLKPRVSTTKIFRCPDECKDQSAWGIVGRRTRGAL